MMVLLTQSTLLQQQGSKIRLSRQSRSRFNLPKQWIRFFPPCKMRSSLLLAQVSKCWHYSHRPVHRTPTRGPDLALLSRVVGTTTRGDREEVELAPPLHPTAMLHPATRALQTRMKSPKLQLASIGTHRRRWSDGCQKVCT